jgi:hypothetical protein
MQPKPMAETGGPFFPSGRSCIAFSSISGIVLDEDFAASDTIATPELHPPLQ